MEQVNGEVGQFGIVVGEGVEHVRLKALTLHETDNWLVVTDRSNAFVTL